MSATSVNGGRAIRLFLRHATHVMTDSVSHGPTIVERFCFSVTLDVLSDVTSPKQAPESAAGRYVFEITEFSGKENGAP